MIFGQKNKPVVVRLKLEMISEANSTCLSKQTISVNGS